MKYGSELRFDDCQNSYHELCILKYHKGSVTVSEDGDNFLCHTCYRDVNTGNGITKLYVVMTISVTYMRCMCLKYKN
jgi:hypothetical protein